MNVRREKKRQPMHRQRQTYDGDSPAIRPIGCQCHRPRPIEVSCIYKCSGTDTIVEY